MNSNHITSSGIAFLFNINSKSVSIFTIILETD